MKINNFFFTGYRPLHYVCFHENSMQERRVEAAALLIAYGATCDIKNRQGETLLTHELRSKIADRTILHAIVKSVPHLPTLESLRIISLSEIINPVASGAQNQGLVKLIKCDAQYSKLLWYKELCKEPRSLQHYCRCVIRKSLGVRRLRKINSLPLPTTLKEYLFLMLDEFR